MDDILNIDYHRRRLLVIALNRVDTKKEAAKLVGLSERSIHRWIQQYDIRWNFREKVYEAKIQQHEKSICGEPEKGPGV